MIKNLPALSFENGCLVFVDQTLLPLQEVHVATDNYERIAEAIERLEIRGAPAIGAAAAYAVALSLKNVTCSHEVTFKRAYARLASTRPTAVNLFTQLDRMKDKFDMHSDSLKSIYDIMLYEAECIRDEDAQMCSMIAVNSLEPMRFAAGEKIKRGGSGKLRILTHCNAGSLATCGCGTALGVIKKAWDEGLAEFVYADETRPLFQGLRLTAFELNKYGIPFSVNTDSTAAFLMAQGNIDLVVTGADRIAANGDSANKIGTYNLAVLCNYHKIPFYIAAPSSTIDKRCLSGKNINIELRSPEEVLRVKSEQIAPAEYAVYSPAFDVTPAELITGIITEKQLYKFPYNF